MSCLFNSMNYFLPNMTSGEIRNQICDYLQNNNPIMDGMATMEILNMDQSDYIQKMRLTSTWGGAIEIQASCNLWQWNVIVRNNRDRNNTQIEFIPMSGSCNRTITLDWTGGHYEPNRA